MNFLNRPKISQWLKVSVFPFLFLSPWCPGWASTQTSDVKVAMDYWAPYYNPARVTVPAGGSIHIVNPTSSPHTVTHVGCRRSGPCAFDTGALQSGQSFTIPALPPGRYPYYCVLHPIMEGEIIVIPDNSMLSQADTQDKALMQTRKGGEGVHLLNP